MVAQEHITAWHVLLRTQDLRLEIRFNGYMGLDFLKAWTLVSSWTRRQGQRGKLLENMTIGVRLTAVELIRHLRELRTQKILQ